MLNKITVDDVKLLNYDFIADVFFDNSCKEKIRSKNVHNSLDMEIGFLYNNIERFCRHNRRESIESYYSLEKGLNQFEQLLKRCLKLQKKATSPKLKDRVASEYMFESLLNQLESLRLFFETTIGEFEIVEKEETLTSTLSTTSKFGKTEEADVPKVFRLKRPRAEHENAFLVKSHLPYYKKHLASEYGKEYLGLSEYFFIDYCLYRIKKGAGFSRRVARVSMTDNFNKYSYKDVYLKVGHLDSKGTRELLDSYGLNCEVIKQKLLLRINEELRASVYWGITL